MIVVFSFLYFIANIDNEKKIIPDWLTIPLIIYGILSSVILAMFLGVVTPVYLSLIGASMMFLVGYAMVYKTWWGGGDFKLFVGLGAVFGLGVLPILASAGVMGLVLKYLVYKTRTIPFGVATFLGYCFFIAVSIIFALI